MKMHKEEKDNEVFVGNTDYDSLKELRQHGIEYRLGNIAYDIDGKEIEGNYLKPLFIPKSSFKKYDIYMRKSCGFIVDD